MLGSQFSLIHSVLDILMLFMSVYVWELVRNVVAAEVSELKLL
jgi:hypothetical protein